jgi:hypothetical protein
VATSEAIQAAGTKQTGGSGVVPIWGQAAALIVLVAFAALGFEAFAGPGPRTRVLGWLPGGSEQATSAPARALYQAESSVRVGMPGLGSEGQERTLVEGDVVLAGDSGRLLRLESGGRAVELRPDEGAATFISNLGAWDASAGRLGGTMARYHGGRWTMDPLDLAPVGAALHPPDAPDDALPDGFTLGPEEDAGRIRRVDERGNQAIRIRASRKASALTLESRRPLPTLDDAFVTVRAVVRGQAGKTLTLTVSDVVDVAGRVESGVDRRTASEEWTTLTVRRRMAVPSPNDLYAVGILDAEGGDWFEVRSVDVFVGVVP